MSSKTEVPIKPAWRVSWESITALDTFELHSPWWISGTTGDDKDVVVAAVRAANEAEACKLITDAYRDGSGRISLRFVDPLGDRSPFSDRFQQADWMAWEPDGRTCNCSEHA